jgi:Trk K+ transport system NAD-binding subunit
VAVALLVVRIVGIFAGSFIGGVVAGDPLRQNALLGFTFITQAGVSIGLAKEIGVEFPPWGNELATLLIAIIVANQLIGPPFFKWAVRKVGEAHVPGTGREDGHRDAVIFGLERQSFALARQLRSHDWNVRVIALNGQDLDRVAEADVEIETIPGLTVEALKAAKVDKAEAVVAILGDDDSLRLCGLLQEQFDVANVIVLLRDRAKAEAFLAYEVTIVEPSTAIVELLEHMVRSPSGAKLLLGMDGQQDVLDVLLENPRLDGRTLRSLNLPLDALILSVRRDDSVLISHGYTRLRIGDTVTVVGSPQALEDVAMRFGA